MCKCMPVCMYAIGVLGANKSQKRTFNSLKLEKKNHHEVLYWCWQHQPKSAANAEVLLTKESLLQSLLYY